MLLARNWLTEQAVPFVLQLHIQRLMMSEARSTSFRQFKRNPFDICAMYARQGVGEEGEGN